MSNTPMNDPNELAAYADQADAPERSEDELSEQQLNEVAGGLRASRNDDLNDRYVPRNDDKNDPNDPLSR